MTTTYRSKRICPRCLIAKSTVYYLIIAASAGEQPPILDIYLDFCLSG
jgi:hypothetical protein